MANYARLGVNNVVVRVDIIDNSKVTTSGGIEKDALAFEHLFAEFGAGIWVKCSYNTAAGVHVLGGTPFRGNYAGIGYTWDSTNQIFWPPKPYTSWVKNTTIARWESPIGAQPELTQEQKDQNVAVTHFWDYEWSEDNQTWDLINHKD